MKAVYLVQFVQRAEGYRRRIFAQSSEARTLRRLPRPSIVKALTVEVRWTSCRSNRTRHHRRARVNFARRVEALGVESLWMGEHVVLFDETEAPYPGSSDGKIPVPAGGGMLV